ncbi:AzlD domain-containing protein [Pelagibacteraceae bacterium]|jgi:branched-subunit amino acid transport protein|nr:AzlD domain-containing protein [Pelagibacteraceae bacterium]|tara:strand:+ start:38 stop:355 length:318 start_codon:yes stop_codon:yes gene_type:complete
MTSSSIVLIIIITSVATYISRVLGVLTSERLSIKSKIFSWFNYVAYSILAALISRMIIFPAGALLESTLLIRLIVIAVCVSVFIYSKKNLVLPTILSFILLTFLV